ncbi:hypothetical protein FHS43_006150 [Streptosporangium becharense]|uniref:Uncharacterized protein n=1 Tax=Streptosporangium becharense TaxID=1816182 RepID=A0A7W9IGX8_9ACTN|nr:hypothetical protein [Streptosporangium becharense]MBB2914838.1 hypothetical protein [Streptosporangium becharense]MBB5820351.1 hypothetical protein [Streptosporangium becharense]
MTTPDVRAAGEIHLGAVVTASPRKPYVTPYAEEVASLPLIFERQGGVPRLAYTDATVQDWMFGMLWARCGIGRGTKVLWPMIHTLRQRRCMLKRLCRVCGRSAKDPGEPNRTWWIIPAAPDDLPATWPTAGPPTCRAHIAEALAACPHLRKGSPVVCTVGDYRPIGVLGNLYAQDGDGRVVETRHQISVGLDEPHLFGRTLATQLIVELHDLRPADVPVP